MHQILNFGFDCIDAELWTPDRPASTDRAIGSTTDPPPRPDAMPQEGVARPQSFFAKTLQRQSSSTAKSSAGTDLGVASLGACSSKIINRVVNPGYADGDGVFKSVRENFKHIAVVHWAKEIRLLCTLSFGEFSTFLPSVAVTNKGQSTYV